MKRQARTGTQVWTPPMKGCRVLGAGRWALGAAPEGGRGRSQEKNWVPQGAAASGARSSGAWGETTVF